MAEGNGCSDEELSDIFPVLGYFKYSHLPEHLQPVSAPFCLMAWDMARNARLRQSVVVQAEVALQRLLDTKDAYVRNQL